MTFAVPGDLDTPTGGYAYDKRIVAELRALGFEVGVLDLGEGYPHPSARALETANVLLTTADPAVPVVIDGLAWGALPALAQALAPSHRTIALVHHPLALETGLTAAQATALRESERAALAYSRHIVVTSRPTARILAADYGVPAERISVALPGTDPSPPARGGDGETVSLLAVGSIVPRKGYDILVAALATLCDLRWRLTIAGDPSRDPAAARRLSDDIARAGLAERIAVMGVVTQDRLDALYDAADLFVLPSRFEGYGMAFTEAVARGVPVVATNAGAIAETVPAQAGVLVPPEDADALARVLRELIGNGASRERLRAGARAAAPTLPGWRESAMVFARAIETLT